MSCHIVSDADIALLVEACWHYNVSMPDDVDRSKDEVGILLYDMNYMSWNWRYEGAEYPEPYVHEDHAMHARGLMNQPLLIYKQARYYTYQSCETPVFEESLVAQLMDALSAACCEAMACPDTSMSRLPEYDELPWGLR